jgi:hypothetical protein
MRRLKAGIVEFPFPVSFQFWQQPVSPSLSGFCMLFWLRYALVLHRSSNARNMQHGTISVLPLHRKPSEDNLMEAVPAAIFSVHEPLGAMHKGIG